ncbi:mannose-1-phosphate guanylyltransferase/mannose-6-phosphate isomerase [Lutimaribacter sp. EGI FJ00015]|uniref:Mannose-1-phosphate guanylyltransferase/mannose-6-phosphate isomerase n=1 Tax=Lutimaribacter degradans TaxID=2945989 RepID=A0ACC5ZZT4_9RHOB|nr:mannose-1-phosphate guanylyltransferase/mannose-6-phosphate isomerase [Lutimaribacter sp. EGI FJ00013]MCM2563869.1 mannose-1-phosphate guanylyltransferase/mannose-6-phosphate isomerase [Lutimaribacter sp. EGI FJ00013]MCO0615059.1 mannose-1-phosphate guanylyltransferase/mannose-6-phosphate isomerase [Lutimaribacter sp. EGI FJ00015]MCO0637704.1 mannose-1-phosphate guanylyltransferase/mannose-6-phosphate isomerase [Lutimaribacter sp. EGI FJ00014]
MITPVLLCGGSGTRLWPVSRKSYPKQFSQLVGPLSLFQASAERLSGPGFGAPVILTGDPFRFIVTEQLARIEQAPRAILIEPDGRNTAPAILAAALWLARDDPGALMLVAPSDHVIPDPGAFRAAIEGGASQAAAGRIVTFGIIPTRPDTGYGYLELEPGARIDADTPQPLAGFVEKPDAAHAARMLQDGRFLWNAGIFLLRADTAIDAFRTHAPALHEAVAASVAAARSDLGFTRLDPGAWDAVEDISIDYAIMEKARDLVVMPYPHGWDDLGSWDAVWNAGGPDDLGNVCSDRTHAIDCHGTLLRSEAEGTELVGIGLQDIIAVAMPDAVLVAHKSQAQRVKEAVTAMTARGIDQANAFPRAHRPWGWFEHLATGERFQVKRIVVNPGAALSLQAHHHRAEHWIVVAGTAEVTVGDKMQLISENQSIYVPLGVVHRLRNPGKLPMVLIEVQTGAYLGEDDIIRYEDLYARD